MLPSSRIRLSSRRPQSTTAMPPNAAEPMRNKAVLQGFRRGIGAVVDVELDSAAMLLTEVQFVSFNGVATLRKSPG